MPRPTVVVIFTAWLAMAGAACRDAGVENADVDGARTGRRYVALGDSFAAGQGLTTPDAAPFSGEVCRTHPGAYPQLVAARTGMALTSVACPGATVADIVERAQHDGMAPQIQAVTDDTAVVTVTVGGNDIGFAPVIGDCVFALEACDRLEADVGAALAELEPRLGSLLETVRSRAPRALVLVVGYPHLVVDPDDADVDACPGLAGPTVTRRVTADEARWLRRAAEDLAGVIERAADGGGARYLDATTPFDGHEVCADEPWLTGVDLRRPASSLHPNERGQEALADLVVAAL